MDARGDGREDGCAETRGLGDRRPHHAGADGLGFQAQPQVAARPAAGRGDPRNPARIRHLRDQTGLGARHRREDFQNAGLNRIRISIPPGPVRGGEQLLQRSPRRDATRAVSALYSRIWTTSARVGRQSGLVFPARIR